MLWSHVTVMFLQDQQTPLHLAAREGHISIVKLLLAEGADVNVMDNVVSVWYDPICVLNSYLSYIYVQARVFADRLSEPQIMLMSCVIEYSSA